MSWKKIILMLVTFGLLLVLMVPTTIAAQSDLNVGLGHQYSTIEAAIFAATDGDTIVVHKGTYNENILVDRSITLIGVGGPVVNAGGIGAGFKVLADNVTIKGFTVENTPMRSMPAIRIESSGCTVSNNIIRNNVTGILIVDTEGNNVKLNKCYLNRYGIRLIRANNNEVKLNNCYNNEIGIYVWGDTNIIRLNRSHNNTQDGISTRGTSTGNLITQNNCFDNELNGIYLPGNENTVSYNKCFDNDFSGIIVTSMGNTLKGNICNSNNWGFSVFGNENTFTHNKAQDNSEFDLFAGEVDNIYSHNKFGTIGP